MYAKMFYFINRLQRNIFTLNLIPIPPVYLGPMPGIALETFIHIISLNRQRFLKREEFLSTILSALLGKLRLREVIHPAPSHRTR
jgi:hypothetical protein